jgi:hypothetical protein
MIVAALFVAARVGVVALALTTAFYALATDSSFVFDMFIRPQLSPAVTAFVQWHHALFAAVSAISAVSVLADLRRLTRSTFAWWVGASYVAASAAAAYALLLAPYLPTLWNDGRGLAAALVALTPLVWLALFDCAVGAPAALGGGSSDRLSDQRQLLVASAGAAAFVFVVHAAAGVPGVASRDGAASAAATLAVAAALDGTAAMAAYAVLNLSLTLAACARQPRRAECAIGTAAAAAVVAGFVDRIVLPSLAIPAGEALVASVAMGVAVSLSWMGCRLRAPRAAMRSGFEILVPGWAARTSIAAAIAVAAAVSLAVRAVEPFDWNFLVQKTLVATEWALVFAAVFALARRCPDRAWTWRRFVWPIAASAGVLAAAVYGTAILAAWRGDARLAPATLLDRYAPADPAFRLVSEALVVQRGVDAGRYQFLTRATELSAGAAARVPSVDFFGPDAAGQPSTRPDIFLFVIDSLRRDYLGTYNPAVTFTPNLDRFAAESFAFRNAFTRYGGTQLAIPSIWSGGPMLRRFTTDAFRRVNALEKLATADRYQIRINDFTVAPMLAPATAVTRLDPDVKSVDTDLCHLVDAPNVPDAGSQPTLTFLAPMNVHILNTRSGTLDPPGAYPGFFAPYASRLQRLDACFGRFVEDLRRQHRYDEAVIIVTSDHGDSLGERGMWGHQFGLFPEDVRIPLLIHVPERLRSALTTDLDRVTFSTDITPTLYALLGHAVVPPAPEWGTPLFVGANEPLLPRRRETFLLMSSYGATFGVLRRNGRLLYVSDLVNGREYAFNPTAGLIGTAVTVTDALEHAGQEAIRIAVDRVSAAYEDRRPSPTDNLGAPR